MGRTAINVAGQALVPTIVAKRQGILDQAAYDAPRNGDPFSDDVDGTAVAPPASPRRRRHSRGRDGTAGDLADARA